jgi:hypothetical protein
VKHASSHLTVSVTGFRNATVAVLVPAFVTTLELLATLLQVVENGPAEVKEHEITNHEMKSSDTMMISDFEVSGCLWEEGMWSVWMRYM